MWYLPFAQAVAETAPTNPSQRPPAWPPFVIIGLGLAVVYFLMLRPQKKQKQQREEMLSKVARGDRVMTIGGMHGEVAQVKEKYVILIVDRDKDVRVKLSRSAIDRIIVPEAAQEEEKA